MPIDFDRRPIDQDTRPVIEMQDVSVRYRLAQERIPSIKEYAIRRIKGQVRYNTFLALDGINLSVIPGEVFGIIGPNGAGKSTLLKVVARVLHPTRGRVRLRGRVAPLLELGAGFDFELTGRENIFLNGAILGFSQRDLAKRVDRIIDFAGLKEFIDSPLRTYSTGMVARLGFSVATDVRPEILIVDEILGVGDAEFQTRSFERIQGFQAQGTTILLVSHSLGNVEEMCSRAIWLDHGKIVALGSAKAVVDRYLGRVRDEEGERLSQEAEKEPVDRWGSRRVEITDVRISDARGNEQLVFQTGQPLVLHLEYEAHEQVISPNFGVAIHRQDGVHITGPNIAFAGMDLGRVEGRGVLTYTIPALPLLDGLYHFSVAVVDSQDQEIMDYHDRTYTFRVANHDSGVEEKYGLLTLGGTWRDLRIRNDNR